MASYKILIKPSAEKDFRPIPKTDRRRLVEKIRQLSLTPRPHGAEKLKGEEYWRVRQGDYRIIYAINDANQTILIEKIGHRKEIYR